MKQTPLAAAVSLALLGAAAVPAQARSDAGGPQMRKVEVTGIRASMAKSLAVSATPPPTSR